VRRLSEVTGKVLRAPDIVARLQAQGMAAPTPGTPEQMTAYIKENLPLWAKVIREANIRIDLRPQRDDRFRTDTDLRRGFCTILALPLRRVSRVPSQHAPDAHERKT
jgi:hypothetical protein